MAVHHGGKVGSAAKTLAKKDSSKLAKSRAGKTLANHKAIDAPIIDGFFESQCVPYWEKWIKNEEKNVEKDS